MNQAVPVQIEQPHRVAVLGLGLMGGSIFLQMAAAGATVIGYDTDPGTREAARAEVAMPAGVADTISAAVADADLVVLAVPLPVVGQVLDALATASYAGLLTDVTSVKSPVAALVAERCPGASWIGGHPMAGREQSGFAAAEPDLVAGCPWALCLEDSTPLSDWLRVAAWVTNLGGRVIPVTAADHDGAVARISHLPHVVAAAVVDVAALDPVGRLALALAAGSFRDATRVAATEPATTAAMCGGNAAALDAALEALSGRIAEARAVLAADDPVAALTEWFTPAHALRTGWSKAAGAEVTFPVSVPSLRDLGRNGGWLTQVAGDGTTVTGVPGS